MKTAAGTQLIAALAAEHAALLKFVALLGREQAMLIENLTDQLLELSEQKSSDALHLGRLAGMRRALLQENIPQESLHPDAIQVWLKTYCPEGLVIWQKLRAMADRAQQLNLTNGELIQMKLRHNQQSLAVLIKAADKANLYGPNGQHSFSPGSGRSLGSG